MLALWEILHFTLLQSKEELEREHLIHPHFQDLRPQWSIQQAHFERQQEEEDHSSIIFQGVTETEIEDFCMRNHVTCVGTQSGKESWVGGASVIFIFVEKVIM